MMQHGLGNVRTNFHSAMPAPPFDPKMLLLPDTVDLQPFVEYRKTTLDQNVRHELMCEVDMGVDLQLMDPRAYILGQFTSLEEEERGVLTFGSMDQEGTAVLDPVDQMLLRDLKEDKLERERNERKERLNKGEAWLRKSEYLTRGEDELYGQPAMKRRTSHKNDLDSSSDEEDEEDVADVDMQQMMSTDEVHAFIEKQFQRSKQLDTLQFHHPDPKQRDLKPVEVMPIVPDMNLWRNSYAQVTFNNMPIPFDLMPSHPVTGNSFAKSSTADRQMIKESMKFNQIYNTALLAESQHPLTTRQDQHLVNYLLPRNSTTANDTETAGSASLMRTEAFNGGAADTWDYYNVREYLMRVESDDNHFDDTYMFQRDKDSGTISYSRIRTKITLNPMKEYSKADVADDMRQFKEKRRQEQRFLVTARSHLTAEETGQSEKRMRDLQPIDELNVDGDDDNDNGNDSKRTRLE